MLVISSREFRNKQGKYFVMAASGEDVVLKSRGNGSFKLVPVTEDDTLISKEYILKPDADLDRAITAEQLLEGIKEDLKAMFKKGKK